MMAGCRVWTPSAVRSPVASSGRCRKAWSVNQLADFAGLARGGVSEILRVKRYPTLRTLLKLAEALDVPVKDLLPDE